MAAQGEPDFRAEIQAAVAGTGLADLRHLADQLRSYRAPEREVPRPDRRVSRREQPAIFRVRVDLEHAHPPIWRRLDIRTDIRLDTLHQVLQATFGWWDCHLHRFALGSSVFDPAGQAFLCPYDVAEGDDGIPATDVRLDETLAKPGDVLRYTYDFGDSWDLTIKLEKVLPLTVGEPVAICLDGRRAAPPEDCGGLRNAEDLATVLADPARFDVEDVNLALQQAATGPAIDVVDPRLVALLTPLRGSPIGDRLMQQTAAALSQPSDEPSPAEKAAALRAHLWFLDRAADPGIELTTAGYLKPAEVRGASQVIPATAGWIGAKNREINTAPVLRFRENLQHLGLLRRRKNALLLTRAGASARTDPERLWSHLATHLPIGRAGTIDAEAGLLTLAYAAIGTDEPIPLAELAGALTLLGWRQTHDRPVDEASARRAAEVTLDVLEGITSEPESRGRTRMIGAASRALARAALRRSS